MKIVVDENIPFAGQAFAGFGETLLLPGRSIDRETLRDAEILIVRSVTRVDDALLEGTSVRFVGTATAGIDHVDTDCLDRRSIRFCSAPASNADSVADYLVALLLRYSVLTRRRLDGLSLGVIGVGHVGSRVAGRAEGLGMTVVRNDPPLRDRGISADWRNFEEACACDVVTVHAPLLKTGPYPTFHLFGNRAFGLMKKDAFFINAARGGIADNTILLDRLRKGRITAGLDVWEGEPAVDPGLLESVFFGTPHIAGYSYDGKVRGTEMVYAGLRSFLGDTGPGLDFNGLKPAIADPVIRLGGSDRSDEENLLEAVLAVYDFEADNTRMKELVAEPNPRVRAERFDLLRRNYPVRREFSNYRVRPAKPDRALGVKLAAAGFIIYSQ